MEAAVQPLLHPQVGVLDLTPDESNELSHLFYHHTSGRVESAEDLRELLAKADMLVPDVVLAIFFTEFGGPDGVICDEFLDMCKIVKTLHLVSRNGGLSMAAVTAGGVVGVGKEDCDLSSTTGAQQDRSADDADEQELTELFERLQCALHVEVPAIVADLIHNKRHAMERTFTGAGDTSRSNTPRPLDADASADLPATLHKLRAYDDTLKAASILGAVASPAFDGSDLTAAAAGGATVAGRRLFSRAPREQVGIAVRPPLDEVLLIAMEVLLEDHHRQPVGIIQHHAIRAELSNFGLVEDGWDRRCSMATLGVEDEYREEDEQQQQQHAGEVGQEQHPPRGVLLADPTLYVPLDVRRFRRLLRTPHQSNHPLKGAPPSTAQHQQDLVDDGPDLLDADDDMDGVQDVLKLMQSNASEAQRRHRRAVSPDDESNDSGIEYVEDPVTGDVTAHLLLKSTTHGGRTARSAANKTVCGGGAAGKYVGGDASLVNDAINTQDLVALAALETDLFMSPSRQRRLKEVGDFVFGRTASGSNLRSGHSHHPQSTGVASPSPVAMHSSYGTPPPPPGVDPAAIAMASSRRSFTPRPREDEEHTTATPDDGGVGDALPTSRRHHTHASFYRMRSLGGGAVAGAEVATSTSSATTTHRVHPLQHKLKQIFVRRLNHVRDRLAGHSFPVSRRAAVHTGLTPENRSLSPTGQVPRGGTTESSPAPHRVSTTAAAPGDIDLSATDYSRRIAVAVAKRRAAVQAAAAEAKYQRDVLDVGFPACDMSYGDFYFVPQLHARPRGTPLYVTKCAPQQQQQVDAMDATLTARSSAGAGGALNATAGSVEQQSCASTTTVGKVRALPTHQVVPGICGDLPAPMELRYRTAQNAQAIDAAHPNHATHNRVALQHSFLSPQALKKAAHVGHNRSAIRNNASTNADDDHVHTGMTENKTSSLVKGDSISKIDAAATTTNGASTDHDVNRSRRQECLPHSGHLPLSATPTRAGAPPLASLLLSSIASPPRASSRCDGSEVQRKRRTKVVDPCSRRPRPLNAVYVAPLQGGSDVAQTLRSAVAKATAELSRHQ